MHRFLVIGVTSLAALVLTGSASAWTWPADGPVLRPFALGSDAYAAGQHRGIDVGGAEGSPVRAPATGTVTFAGSVPTHGRGVTILTGDGYSVTLFHLGSVGVQKGDAVGEGAPVGTMGSSGDAEHSVPSVHLGIRLAALAEGYVDPLSLLPARAPAPAPAPPAAPTPAPGAASAPAASSQPPPAPPAPAAPAPADAAAQPVAAPPAAAVDRQAPASPPTVPETATAPGPAQLEATTDTGGLTVRSGNSASATAPASAVTRMPVSASRIHVAEPGREIVARRATSLMSTSSQSTERSAGPRPVTAVRESPAHAARVAADAPRAARADTKARRSGVADARRPVEARVRSRRGATADESTPRHAVPASSSVVVASRGAAPSARAAASPGGSVPKSGPDHTAPVPTMLALVALVALVAVAASRKAARRIGVDGALLRHDADLLRQFDAAHWPRVHDGRGGRPCTPPAAARS